MSEKYDWCGWWGGILTRSWWGWCHGDAKKSMEIKMGKEMSEKFLIHSRWIFFFSFH